MIHRRAVLGLGANLEAGAALPRALPRLATLPHSTLVATSPCYHSRPWGGASGGRYCNAAVLLRTALRPWQLLAATRRIETELGRRRGLHYGPRSLDIDLLALEGVRLNTPALVLPHPLLDQRRFALQPLVDLAPDLALDTGLRARQALRICPDPGPLWTAELEGWQQAVEAL